jgi:transcription initiation factor IIE alpha subunit
MLIVLSGTAMYHCLVNCFHKLDQQKQNTNNGTFEKCWGKMREGMELEIQF